LQALRVSQDAKGDRIDVLKSLLDAAHGVLDEIQGDRLFGRLVKVFARMPEGDRAIVIGALERELDTRLLSQEVADSLTRIELRPNPNARIYLRVVEPDDKSEDVEKLAFLRAVYAIQRGIDALDPHWREMIVQAFRQMDPAARAQIERFNRAIQELLDEAARGGTPAEEPVLPDAAEAPPAAMELPARREK
jgi:hypothetical protein